MIDTRYILARDNYTCQSCKKECGERESNFYKVHLFEGDDDASNHVLLCSVCSSQRTHVSITIPSKEYTGRLTVITGPMFASKSTVTRSLYNKYKVFNPKCAWFKPTQDDRSTGTETHNEEIYEAITISSDRPDKDLPELLSWDVIIIDEAQFFSDRLLYVVHTLLAAGKLVIANGLKLTARRDIFGIMHYLMAEADDIICLKAVCSKCKIIDIASRTKSYKKLPSVQTGGADSYYSVCPLCDGDSNENNRS
jgi:thymidine kinase